MRDIKVQLVDGEFIKCRNVEENYLNSTHNCIIRFGSENDVTLRMLHEKFANLDNIKKINVFDGETAVSEIEGLNKVGNIAWKISENEPGEYMVSLAEVETTEE